MAPNIFGQMSQQTRDEMQEEASRREEKRKRQVKEAGDRYRERNPKKRRQRQVLSRMRQGIGVKDETLRKNDIDPDDPAFVEIRPGLKTSRCVQRPVNKDGRIQYDVYVFEDEIPEDHEQQP